jgi:hypothetical protein
MLGITKRRAILVALFLLGLLVVGAWALGWIPAHAEICEESEKSKNCASYNIFFYSTWQTIKFLDRYSALITAVATATIGIFTYTLKTSTDRLWDAGEKQRKLYEDTAKAQLRAYVFVYNGQVSLVTIGATKILAYKLSIELRNFGQTPARKYTTWIDHAVRNVDDLPFTRPAPIDKRLAPTIMGPTAGVTIEDATPFNVDELDDIRAAKKAIFIWGGCDYVDAFECDRYFIFRFKISGHENQGLWRLRSHEIGEEGN